MTSEQRLQLSRGMSAERLVLLLLIPLVSSQSAKCKCPKIPPKDFTVPEDGCFEGRYRYKCIPGYMRKPGRSAVIRCREKNGVSKWNKSKFECITDPNYRPPPTTTRAKCKCPKIPPKNFTVPEDGCFEGRYRYTCIPGYIRKPGTSGIIRCREKNGVSLWEESKFKCISHQEHLIVDPGENVTQLIVGPGQDVTLPCLGPRVEQTSVDLQWTRTDGLLHLHIEFMGPRVMFRHNNQEAFRGRLNLPLPMDGDFSLTLQNVNIRDTGGYKCVVTYFNPGGDDVKFTRSIFLNVSGEDQWLEDRIGLCSPDWSSYLEENQFIIITVSVSLVCVVLLLYVMFLIIRYKTSLGFSKLRLSQRSRTLSWSRDVVIDF